MSRPAFRVAALCGAAATALFPVSAVAQGGGLKAPGATYADPDVQADRAGGATLDKTLSSLSGVELTAAAEGAAATIKLGRVTSRKNGIHTWSVTATSPFDSDAGEGGFSLDSFTAGSSLKIEYTWSNLFGEIVNRADRVLAFCESEAKARSIAAPALCDSHWVDANARDRLDDFNRLAVAPGAFAISIAPFGKVGHKEFKYLDAASLAESEETETPWAVGVAVAVQPVLTRRLYVAKFEHQRDYEAQEKRTICPAATGAPVTCLTGALGPPKHDDKDLVTLEFRQRFVDHFGFSVAATYDIGSEDFGVDVPVYLVGGEDYSGGIRVGFKREGKSTKKDKDDLTVGVFIARSLSLY